MSIQLPDQLIVEIIQDAKENISNKQVIQQLTLYGAYQRVEKSMSSGDVDIDEDTLS